jgi:hypothetical protein
MSVDLESHPLPTSSPENFSDAITILHQTKERKRNEKKEMMYALLFTLLLETLESLATAAQNFFCPRLPTFFLIIPFLSLFSFSLLRSMQYTFLQRKSFLEMKWAEDQERQR